MSGKHLPCAYWREGDVCEKNTEPGYKDYCVLGPCSQLVPSNGDLLRGMDDEELADEVWHTLSGFLSREELLVYLASPAGEEVKSDA